MTAPDIVNLLFSDKGVTAARVQKARGLALRSGLEWAIVVAAMSTDQRQQVEQANG